MCPPLELTQEVEAIVQSLLPNSFGVIFDGWTETSTATHYLGIYAVFPDDTNACQTILLAFSPLLDETDLSAKRQLEFLEATLCVFKKSKANVSFLVGDNCSTNVKISRDMKLPLIGCASHRFNLAVNCYLKFYDSTITKVNELMKKMSSIKRRAQLRKTTDLAPITRNTTRWTSTFEMMDRYRAIRDELDWTDRDLINFIPAPSENALIDDLVNEMAKLNSVSKKLQEDRISLHDIRLLFDSVMNDFPGLEHYLGYEEGSLTHHPDFEIGISNHVAGLPLTQNQIKALSCFTSAVEEGIQTATTSYADNIISKKSKKNCDLQWIPGTSNIVERFFSRAKLTLDDQRKRVLPMHFEQQVFLFANKRLWNIKNVDNVVTKIG